MTKTLKLLRIYLTESDKHDGKIIYETIMLKAREAGITGATVFRGIAGYGAHHEIHTVKLLDLSQTLPVVVEIIDTEEKIKIITDLTAEIAPKNFATLQDVEVLKP